MLDICEIPSFFFEKFINASTFLKLTLKYMVSAICCESPGEDVQQILVHLSWTP